MEELIRLGAYRKGSDPNVDVAIRIYPKIEAFLAQDKDDSTTIDQGFQKLTEILGIDEQTLNRMHGEDPEIENAQS